MYTLTSIVPLLYSLSLSLSLSLSHFEFYIRIPKIEDSIQSYQWAPHWKNFLLR